MLRIGGWGTSWGWNWLLFIYCLSFTFIVFSFSVGREEGSLDGPEGTQVPSIMKESWVYVDLFTHRNGTCHTTNRLIANNNENCSFEGASQMDLKEFRACDIRKGQKRACMFAAWMLCLGAPGSGQSYNPYTQVWLRPTGDASLSGRLTPSWCQSLRDRMVYSHTW